MSKYSKKNVFRSIVDFIVMGMGIKALGFIRSILMAKQFGLSMESDVFYLVVSILFILASLFGKAVQTVLIPLLNKAETEGGVKQKQNTVSNILNLMTVVTIGICIVAFLVAKPFIRLVLSGNATPEAVKLGTLLLRAGLPMVFFYNLASIYRSYLQSEMLFKESAMSLLPLNLVYIFYLVFLTERFGIIGLMVAQVTGIAAQLLLQWPVLRRLGYKRSYRLDLHDPMLYWLMKRTPPVLLGIAANDLNSIVDKALASRLPVGSISALEYGLNFTTSIRMLFISVINQVMYPLLSKKAQEDDREGLNDLIVKTTRYVTLVALPGSVLLARFALPVIQGVFQRGAFGYDESLMASVALLWYGLGMWGMGLSELYTQVFYSLGEVKIPVITSVLTLLSNLVLNLILMRYLGHGGLALATSLSAYLMIFFLLYHLKRRLGFSLTGHDLLFFGKIFVLSLLGSFIMQFFYQFLDGRFGVFPLRILVLLFLAFLGMLPFFLLGMVLFRVEEMKEILIAVKEKRKKH